MNKQQKMTKLLGEKVMLWVHDPGSKRDQEECPNGIWRDQRGYGVCHFDAWRPFLEINHAHELVELMVERGFITQDHEIASMNDSYEMSMAAFKLLNIEK